ncbi:MAG: CopD family protein [Proteobacteria bacterium]|nr:CopD family protein [Pseudomonadota bacterium]
MSLLLMLHVLAAVIWVGGMFFAHQVTRPAALALEPPLRLTLWANQFSRFFPWVWACVIILPITGYVVIFNNFGGFASTTLYIHLMHVAGWLMIGIFLHVFFAPYKRLRKAVADQDWPEGAKQLAQIRKMIGFNIILGLSVVAVASAGTSGAMWLNKVF